MGKLFKDDIGNKIRVDLGTSLVDATLVKFKMQLPDGTTADWTASIESPSTGGFAIYYIVAGNLSQAGKWKLSAYVEFSDGSKINGETATFMVYDRFRDA